MIKELIWDSSLFGKKIGELKNIPKEKQQLALAIEKARARGLSLYSLQAEPPAIL